MESIINEIGINNMLVFMTILTLILLVITIITMVKTIKLNKRYKKFMKKLGNNENIEEDLENYMYKVERVEKQNAEILSQINELNTNLQGCLQKVGIVRYSAFQDTGSDLSFSLALLNDKNNGVVMNGIYSREMSNIYAKPIEDGKSSYTLTEEEQQALDKAINQK